MGFCLYYITFILLPLCIVWKEVGDAGDKRKELTGETIEEKVSVLTGGFSVEMKTDLAPKLTAPVSGK